jgi:hypothetical protein
MAAGSAIDCSGTADVGPASGWSRECYVENVNTGATILDTIIARSVASFLCIYVIIIFI